ncbi:hypothetical protein [Streptomyces odontomachi]|uniref:hypothetical protein n=1 Tax=Streptomyces odontomachi TaxID=2944940 RepID=UPI0021087A1E|nr:hypothetical protein [Streptomyces sp. ODS25]
MSWNLEVVAVRTDHPDDAVPDVFVPEEASMCFEDATSVSRAPGLCAAQVGEWVLVIDVDCRLSGHAGYLAEASESTELHLVRIAGSPYDPVILHYRDGRPIVAAHDLAACLEIAPCDYEDGETVAMTYLRESTGVSFGGDEMFDAKYTLYLP